MNITFEEKFKIVVKEDGVAFGAITKHKETYRFKPHATIAMAPLIAEELDDLKDAIREAMK